MYYNFGVQLYLRSVTGKPYHVEQTSSAVMTVAATADPAFDGKIRNDTGLHVEIFSRHF